MATQHHYQTIITWTGNTGQGTAHYRAYERAHTVSVEGKPDMLCSSDPAFRGDPSRHNPEELLLAALSACHMLWYLHLCAEAGVVVLEYTDRATGVMEECADRGGHFTEVTLHPEVVVAETRMVEQAMRLHQQANARCFIANSVRFPVWHSAKVSVGKHTGA